MNIFQLYLYGRTHIWSLIVVGISILIGIYFLRKRYPVHISTMMSLSIATLGTNFYEIVFGIFLYFGKIQTGFYDPTHFSGLFAFVLGEIAALSIISIIHIYKPFITFRNIKFVFVGFLVLLLCLVTMFVTGFFKDLTFWVFYSGTDPHNWLWGLSKALGFWIFLPLIKRV